MKRVFHSGDRVKLIRLDKYHKDFDPEYLEIMRQLVGKVGVLKEDEYLDQSRRGGFDVFLVEFNLGGKTYLLDFLRSELERVDEDWGPPNQP